MLFRSDGTDGVSAAVLGQGPWDDLQGGSDSLVRPLDDTVQGLGLETQLVSNLHLSGATSGNDEGVLIQVPGHIEGVLQVPLHLIEDVLAGASQQDGTGLGVLALLKEGEILVSNLPDLEQSTVCANVVLSDLISPVDNGGATGSGHSQFTITIRKCNS